MNHSRLLLVCLMGLAAVPAGALTGLVVGVSDGDTLTLLADERKIRVRLGQIDAPERGQPASAGARRALLEKVLDRQVRVEARDTDEYGRTVGRVWLGERDINRELVREGHAWAYRYYLEDARLLDDEAGARRARRGLWAQSDPVPPWRWRRGVREAERTPTSEPVLADFRCGKRFCREMTSCEEAMFHLKQCAVPTIDGDGDGLPCEALCRRDD